jgi:flagellar biosynthetic protein FliQ
MDAAQVASVLREALIVSLKLSGPPLLVSLAVGLTVSLVQAATQISEATLTFLPKLILVAGALALLGPFMAASLTDYSRELMDQIIAVGGH